MKKIAFVILYFTILFSSFAASNDKPVYLPILSVGNIIHYLKINGTEVFRSKDLLDFIVITEIEAEPNGKKDTAKIVFEYCQKSKHTGSTMTYYIKSNQPFRAIFLHDPSDDYRDIVWTDPFKISDNELLFEETE